MNKIIISLQAVTIVGLVAISVWLYKTNSSIAYIDTSKLMEASNEMKAIRKQSEDEAQKLKANTDTLMQEFQTELKKYEKEVNKMSAREKDMARQLLEAKRGQLVQYQQASQQKVAQDQQQKAQAVLANINKYITDYGQAKGYKVILATTNGNIAYADQGIDITQEIIAGINGTKQ